MKQLWVGHVFFRFGTSGFQELVEAEEFAALTKLRASDGETLGTFAVGSRPVGVAFDGANIWVANALSKTVTKLRASEEEGDQSSETFAVGNTPVVVAFDGANIWVTNLNGNTVSKL